MLINLPELHSNIGLYGNVIMNSLLGGNNGQVAFILAYPIIHWNETIS